MSEVLKTEQLNKIREIVRKMVRERMIDEMNTTGNIEGYNTPYAFSGKDSEKKKAKRQADLTGYTVVSEKKYPSFADPLEGFPTEYKELLKKLQRSNDSDERTELIDKMNVIRKNIKLKPLTNELINENRWLELKNEESTAQAKIGRGISNINKQLREMERFLNWYGKIKNESGVSNKSYWKRTNSHIYSIQERLLKLDQKIRQISE